MFVNSFYSSTSDSCGISIFNRHLRDALSHRGFRILDTNLRIATGVISTSVGILHYVPGGFTSPEAANALIQLLVSRQRSQKLFVILHGLYSYEEHCLLDDVRCRKQEQHIRLMLQTADSISALSDSAAKACRTWQIRFGGRARLLRLDHPGLFAPTPRVTTTRGSYALVGGISKSKKIHTTGSILTLLDLCRRQGLRVWEHWTNLPTSAWTPQAWKRTFGLLSDIQWGELVSNARVVLCPYQTRYQSVSGLISEALSAHRFVLSTSFKLALEMRERYPALMLIEDDLQRWPHLIRHLPRSNSCITTAVPTWDSFASSMALELSTAASEITGSAGQSLLQRQHTPPEKRSVARRWAAQEQMRVTQKGKLPALPGSFN